MVLEKEMNTYKQKLSDLLASEGKFVVIHGDLVGGVYDTYEDAIQCGYEKFGLDSFLVKRIESVEQVQCFTREMLPCRM